MEKKLLHVTLDLYLADPNAEEPVEIYYAEVVADLVDDDGETWRGYLRLAEGTDSGLVEVAADEYAAAHGLDVHEYEGDDR